MAEADTGKPTPTDTPPVIALESPGGAPAAITPPEPGAGPAADAPAPAAPPRAAPQRDWRDDRIAKLTAQLHEARAAKPAPAAAGSPGLTEPVVPASQVERRAQELADSREFNRQAQAIEASGRADFPDFDARIGSMANTQDLRDPVVLANYHSFISAAMAAGGEQTHELLYSLSSDLNEATRIMALPPAQQGVALAKRLVAPAPALAGVPRTTAPKPIAIPQGRGANATSLDPAEPGQAEQMSDAAWFAAREKQVSARRQARE